MKQSGFFYVPEQEAPNLVAQYQSSGYRIFELPKNMQSRDDFFDGVRKVLPLDPPLSSNRSWDGLYDSVRSGLFDLQENNILIIWPSVGYIKNADIETYIMIDDIFEDLPPYLNKEKIKLEGIQFNLAIIGII